MILNGKEIANRYSNILKGKIDSYLSNGYRKPRLDIYLLSKDVSSIKYVELKKNKGEEIGVDVNIITDISNDEVINSIKQSESNNDIDGVMVQLPVSESYDRNQILQAIPISKDVDGLNPLSLGKILHKDSNAYLSATAQGIVYLLEDTRIDLKGKDIVIINDGIEIGLPMLAHLLLNKSTVQICHINTKNLKEKIRLADVVITATGVKHLIDNEDIKYGSIVVDCGYSFEDGKVYGDVNTQSIENKAEYVTPVPGGVGPMTVMSLFSNTLKSYEQNYVPTEGNK